MSRWSDEIETLDPSVDFERIVYLLGAYEFAWDIEKALEFALFRTYAVPSISGLLARTGAFRANTRKRYDDTELLLSEISENGQNSERGRAAMARINEMHNNYRISNDDMLYVLTTFVVEPVRWLDRFGQRPMTQKERRAWTNYYRALGHKMDIKAIPRGFDAFVSYGCDYEDAHFKYADSNADATPPSWVERFALISLWVRSNVLRLLPSRRRPRLITARRRSTYPSGYKIGELGTFPKGSDID